MFTHPSTYDLLERWVSRLERSTVIVEGTAEGENERVEVMGRPVSVKICTRGVDALGSAIGVPLGKRHDIVTSAYVSTGRVTRTSRFQFLLKASNHI